MIVVDACVIIDFLAERSTPEVNALSRLLQRDLALLAPSTVTELLSDPAGGSPTAELIHSMERLVLDHGYWDRAGQLRSAMRGAGRKAALGDALLAQACIDADLPLLTSDRDFLAFAELSELKLV